MRKIYQATISKIDKSPNGNVAFVYVALGDNERSFEFLAGQFVVLNCKIGDQIIRRSYSIATTMDYYKETGEIGFIVKIVYNGAMTTYLVENAQIGDNLEVVGPVGRMTCEPNDDLDYLLISSGSGLGPIRSIYNTLKSTQKYKKIYQIFGERTKNDLLELEDFVGYNKAQEDKIIKNLITLSREEFEGFYSGYVQKYISLALSDLDRSKLRIYICGKPAMVEECIEILLNESISNEFIHFEKY